MPLLLDLDILLDISIHINKLSHFILWNNFRSSYAQLYGFIHLYVLLSSVTYPLKNTTRTYKYNKYLYMNGEGTKLTSSKNTQFYVRVYSRSVILYVYLIVNSWEMVNTEEGWQHFDHHYLVPTHNAWGTSI